jgi:hypothetical protein
MTSPYSFAVQHGAGTVGRRLKVHRGPRLHPFEEFGESERFRIFHGLAHVAP